MTTNHHPAFVALSRWIIEEAAPFVWGVIDHPKFDKTPRILRVALNPAPTTPDGVIRSLSVFYARTLKQPPFPSMRTTASMKSWPSWPTPPSSKTRSAG